MVSGINRMDNVHFHTTKAVDGTENPIDNNRNDKGTGYTPQGVELTPSSVQGLFQTLDLEHSGQQLLLVSITEQIQNGKMQESLWLFNAKKGELSEISKEIQENLLKAVEKSKENKTWNFVSELGEQVSIAGGVAAGAAAGTTAGAVVAVVGVTLIGINLAGDRLKYAIARFFAGNNINKKDRNYKIISWTTKAASMIYAVTGMPQLQAGTKKAQEFAMAAFHLVINAGSTKTQYDKSLLDARSVELRTERDEIRDLVNDIVVEMGEIMDWRQKSVRRIRKDMERGHRGKQAIINS